MFIDRITISGRQVRIEGRPATILAAMQNKTAVRDGVPTAVNNWLPIVDEFRNFLMSEEADIVLEQIKDF